MTKNILLAAALSLCSHSFSQDKYRQHLASVETFVKAYNGQDYALMQKPIGFIGKAIITKKMLQKEYGPFFKENGALEIDTVIFSSRYNATAKLGSLSDPGRNIYLTFNFSEKGKIEGFGFGYPTLVYRKKQSRQDGYSISQIRQIDSIIRSHTKFNGCVLVSGNDQVIYERSQGFSDMDRLTPLNDTTGFLLASCSKQFTATAIMMLREEGKLKLTDPVKLYLPGFPYEQVTIEHLLTHTSGLPDYFTLIQKYADKSRPVTNNDVLKLLADHPQKLGFTPDTRFEYSNTGYVMLSLVIEKASGMSYKAFMENRIFKPLGMPHTLVYNRRGSGGLLENYALGYIYSGAQHKYVLPDSLPGYAYVSYMDGITGDDGISSCVKDLKTWTEALNAGKVVTPGSRDLMYASHRLANGEETNYGFGFIVRKGSAIEDIVYHSGSWPGYATMILHLQERNESIFILSNTGYEMSFLTDQILSVLLR